MLLQHCAWTPEHNCIRVYEVFICGGTVSSKLFYRSVDLVDKVNRFGFHYLNHLSFGYNRDDSNHNSAIRKIHLLNTHTCRRQTRVFEFRTTEFFVSAATELISQKPKPVTFFFHFYFVFLCGTDVVSFLSF